MYCNGEWHDLHEHLEIHFATPVFAFPEAVFDTTATPADGIHLALNESTWDSFFSMVQFTPEGLISKKGLLEYGSVVHLHVTDMINEAKWYLLAKRAESLGVKLVVVPAPKVELPPALLRVCKPRNIQSLNPVAPIRVYGTNDMDFVLSKFPFPTDCVVPISKDTRFESLFIEAQFDMQGNLIGEDSDLLKALRTGKHVVLKGSFSTELVQKLHSLFTIHGLLIVNGRPLKINPSGSLTFITESKQAFNNVNFMPVTYRPYREFEQLDEILRSRLKDCYQKLKITPRFSHFVNFPQDKALHMRWLEQLEKSLHLAAGVALDTGLPPVSSSSDSQASIEKETSPQDVIDFLYGENDHPFVFLVSESGTGKTFLMRTALPEYAQGINDPIKVYNGMSELKQWLVHIEGKAILFIDEANISSEQYHIFDNLTRGERVIWFDGKRYELAREQKIVFAGNPHRYGGRLEADLFRRFPLYLEFKAHPLELILDPILDIDKKYFQEPGVVLALVQKWYRRAQIAGLNITPRNAQMMCMRAYELKFSFPYFEEQFLVHYAILEQLKTLYADKEKTREIRGTMKEKLLKDDVLWKAKGNDLKKALTEELPKMSSELWVWTPSRQKIAITLLGLLHIQQLKKDNYFDKSHGISGFLLEGIQGLGKSRMLLAVLREKNIPYLIIPANDPVQARALLLQAFRQGIVAVMDEINSFPDEKLLNDLLSGIDPEFPDNKPIPGFCLLATQNPAFFNKKEVLSKALDNRFMTLTFKEYSPEELQTIIMNCFKLKKDPTDQLIAEWTHAKDYARQEGFFLPDTRTLFAQAQEDMEAISQAQVEDDPEDEGERREKNDNPAPIKKQRI
ncbi:MAG: hypothetical protein M1486_00625 [Gammaproteobacteria bacterium]|nr:hypothetical protein [Gammaproteobacteria bacterium]